MAPEIDILVAAYTLMSNKSYSKVKQWPKYSTLSAAARLLCTFVQYLIAFWSRRETACDVTSGGGFVVPIVPDTRLKFRYRRLNRYREILPEAAECGIFNVFSR